MLGNFRFIKIFSITLLLRVQVPSCVGSLTPDVGREMGLHLTLLHLICPLDPDPPVGRLLSVAIDMADPGKEAAGLSPDSHNR